MKASDHITQVLVDNGVTHVFEMIGGMITHLIDSIASDGRIQLVSMHHEQGAAFAADGYGRIRGVPGVSMATSGPGATNLITGIGSCYFDSVPAVFITGQVNRHELKKERGVRQLGFQETDIVPMVRPVTKSAVRIDDPNCFSEQVRNSFAIAKAGRPGPVLIDIPMDVQRLDVPTPELAKAADPIKPNHSEVENIWRLVGQAKRPLILVGGGIRSAIAQTQLEACIHLAQVPVVHSLMGVDCLPSENRLRTGMIGSYGNRWANLIVAQADLLLVLGSRLDVRQTGSDPAAFAGEKKILHVDCDPSEVANRVPVHARIITDLRAFLEVSQICLATMKIHVDEGWIQAGLALRHSNPDNGECKVAPGKINPNQWIRELSQASHQAGTVAVDVGQHQMWAAQSWEIAKGQRFITSGGMGSMGYALPAAIGAYYANPTPVVVIAGDGGFQCNIQELETIKRGNIPLKIVVLNNHCHGMVRQFQESYFNGRYRSTVEGYSAPDFVKVAQAYGIDAMRIQLDQEMAAGLAWLWADPLQPALLEVDIPMAANAYPKLAFGRGFPAMEPDERPIEMEGT